jgi:DNA-directed RNA polymerase beta subunit
MLNEQYISLLKKGKMAWNELVDAGVIEYLDASEEENTFIALEEEDLTKEHTHLEISPVTILGLCTSLVPYSNYCSPSRLIRGSKIQKQGLGLYAANFLTRLDTDANILHYPQRPIVRSFTHELFNYDSHPFGQNFTIALMSYEGYNMQDAIILNKGSVEKGLARSTYFRPYSLGELRYSGGLVDQIGIPDKEVKGYKSEQEYKHLESDGIVYTGARVKQDDVLHLLLKQPCQLLQCPPF